MLHSALLRRLPPAAHESPLRLRRIAQRVEQALCAGASTGAWYEIDLHLRRHEQTIIGCWATLLDRDRRPIRVPRVFFGPERFLVLDPLGGIQSGDLWMQPGHVARVQWMITPGDGLSTSDLRRVRGFTRPRCESIAPDQVPF
jgi:hypothetical protein